MAIAISKALRIKGFQTETIHIARTDRYKLTLRCEGKGSQATVCISGCGLNEQLTLRAPHAQNYVEAVFDGKQGENITISFVQKRTGLSHGIEAAAVAGGAVGGGAAGIAAGSVIGAVLGPPGMVLIFSPNFTLPNLYRSNLQNNIEGSPDYYTILHHD